MKNKNKGVKRGEEERRGERGGRGGDRGIGGGEMTKKTQEVEKGER